MSVVWNKAEGDGQPTGSRKVCSKCQPPRQMAKDALFVEFFGESNKVVSGVRIIAAMHERWAAAGNDQKGGGGRALTMEKHRRFVPALAACTTHRSKKRRRFAWAHQIKIPEVARRRRRPVAHCRKLLDSSCAGAPNAYFRPGCLDNVTNTSRACAW